LKISSRTLIKLSQEIHENNKQLYKTNRAQKGKGIVRKVLIGGRYTNYSRDWRQSFNEDQFEGDLSDNSIDFFIRLEGKRLFVEPSLRFVNSSYQLDSISFDETPSITINRDMREVIFGTDVGFYILKNEYFQPFIKVGLSFPLATSFESEVTTADTSIDDLTFENDFGNRKYAPNLGLGLKLSLNRFSAIVSYSTQKVTSSANGEMRYNKTFFTGTLSEFEGPRGETFLGDFSETSGRLEFALAFTLIKK